MILISFIASYSDVNLLPFTNLALHGQVNGNAITEWADQSNPFAGSCSLAKGAAASLKQSFSPLSSRFPDAASCFCSAVNWRLVLVGLVIDRQSERHGVSPMDLSTESG